MAISDPSPLVPTRIRNASDSAATFSLKTLQLGTKGYIASRHASIGRQSSTSLEIIARRLGYGEKMYMISKFLAHSVHCSKQDRYTPNSPLATIEFPLHSL